MIRILLVDTQVCFRQSLARVLALEGDLAVVGEVSSVPEAHEAALVGWVNVVVTELRRPDGEGYGLIAALHAAHPSMAILALAPSEDRSEAARAVGAGASGVLPKNAGLEEVIQVLRHLGAGGRQFSPVEKTDLLRTASRLREQDRHARGRLDRLTCREREVLRALADGLGDIEIAKRLGIGAQTTRWHMKNILIKLEVDSRLQALIFSVRHGVVSIGRE